MSDHMKWHCPAPWGAENWQLRRQTNSIGDNQGCMKAVLLPVQTHTGKLVNIFQKKISGVIQFTGASSDSEKRNMMYSKKKTVTITSWGHLH